MLKNGFHLVLGNSFFLRYHAGQLPEAIALAVNWTANAVRVALTRAKKSLRECMQHRLAWESKS